MTNNRTVIPIPPDFSTDESLDTDSTSKYLKYLQSNGAKCVMSTAGTSSFNLMNVKEIHQFNSCISSSNIDKKILGMPMLSKKDAIQFALDAKNNYLNKQSYLMPLYPDRWYDDNTIKDFFTSVSEASEKPVYIHCMPMRAAVGGIWDYTSEIINYLNQRENLCGIKEEHSNFSKSYNFVSKLNRNIDVIVAGGSMRRHQYLKTAGANSLLSGVGNFFPSIEQRYFEKKDVQKILDIESNLFEVFMKIGWHKSLRFGLKIFDLTCYGNRMPWPELSEEEMRNIKSAIHELKIKVGEIDE